jgi:Zn finger protein HypA/HybF involved in hydrogenase expression
MSEDCKHEWKEEYYGIRCAKCDLFYPDNSNWFAPIGHDIPDESDEETQVCPYCNGTNLDMDGDSGGGCTHCFNGHLPKGF